MEISFHEPLNLGFIVCKVPDEILAEIKKEVKQIQHDFTKAVDHRHNLVGHINHEYTLEKSKPFLEPFLLEIGIHYNNRYNYVPHISGSGAVSGQESFDLTLDGYWVNFQKKHEFNPMHTHTGIYSFVIWLSMPFDNKQEEALYPIVNGPNRTSKFTFHYTDIIGNIGLCSIPADRDLEGHLVFFPSRLNHSVNPFYTSDDYRISVSGNLLVKPDVGRVK